MSDFTFRGFTTGSSVAITATQGANSANGSVTAWGQGGLASLDISVNGPPTLMAPSAIWFQATNLSGFDPQGPGTGETYDPRLHEITYIWTVRGAPLPPFTAPENLADGWNDPNRAYGPEVAMVFPAPGDYTVDLLAIDGSGNFGTAETSFTITDPGLAYPGTRTICYSNDGGESWAGEEPGCLRVTTVSALQSTINSANTPTRVLFKRGQTVSDLGELIVDNGRLSYVGSWGTGTNPRITNNGRFEYQNSHVEAEVRFVGIDFIGNWNGASETGSGGNPLNMTASTVSCDYLLHGCTINSHNALVPNPRTGTPISFVVSDTFITGWRDYGIRAATWNDGSGAITGNRFALVGSRVMQRVDALNGGDNATRTGKGGSKTGDSNDHGPVRIADMERVYIGASDLFSRNGWSAALAGGNPDAADQPALRVNEDLLDDAFYNVDRVTMEGGFQVIKMNGFSNNRNPGNYIFDKVLMIATAKLFGPFVRASFGGSTFRNILAARPNVPYYPHPDSEVGYFVLFDAGNIQANAAEPIAVYNCSLVSLVNGANDPGQPWAMYDGASGGFATVTLDNNLVHAPFIDAPVTPAMPLDLSASLSGVAARYAGVAYDSGPLDSSYSTAGATIPVPRPEPTSSAYRTATSGRVAYDDFFGTVRGPDPSRGAVEPN